MSVSSVEFARFALSEVIAPRQVGNIKMRLNSAREVMRRREWTDNRVRDCWYADPRISLSADEIRDLEEVTGLKYGKQEARELDELIARADALLGGPDAGVVRALIDAFRQALGALDRSRTE